MSRRLLVLVALMAFSAATAQAQTFSLNAGATVTSVVSVTTLGDLAFTAPLVPGGSATVTPANGGRAQVSYNEPANITVPAYVMLAGASSAQLRVDLLCAESPSASSAAPTPFAFGCVSGFTVPISGNVGGSHFVYIGGTVTGISSATAAAGSYAGTFAVTATYVVY